VMPAALAPPEAWTHLEDALVARREQPFHVQFGRRAQVVVAGRFRVDVQFRGRHRDAQGRFDFGEAGPVEERADRPQNATAQFQLKF